MYKMQHMDTKQLSEKEAFQKFKENLADSILDGKLDSAFSGVSELKIDDDMYMYFINFREPVDKYVYRYKDKSSVELPPKNGKYSFDVGELTSNEVMYSRKLEDSERYGLELVERR